MKTKIAIDLNDVIRSYTSQFASQYKKILTHILILTMLILKAVI